MTNTRNDDLIPLIGEAYEAFAKGDRVKASAFRAKINIKLRKRGVWRCPTELRQWRRHRSSRGHLWRVCACPILP